MNIKTMGYGMIAIHAVIFLALTFFGISLMFIASNYFSGIVLLLLRIAVGLVCLVLIAIPIIEVSFIVRM